VGQEHHGLLRMGDLLTDPHEEGLIVDDGRHAVLAGDVRGRDDDELPPGDALAVRDPLEDPARHLGAHGDALERTFHGQVVGVAGGAEDLGSAFLPSGWGADHGSLLLEWVEADGRMDAIPCCRGTGGGLLMGCWNDIIMLRKAICGLPGSAVRWLLYRSGRARA